MEPPSHLFAVARTNRHYDVAIVGAGPVGLAVAIELSQLGLAVLVLDRRPPLERDTRARPQLLVARTGDLAHLAELGVDVRDDKLVSLLAIRTERDLASGTVVSGELRKLPRWFDRAERLDTLARQPPIALVPIAKLQQALLARALNLGAEVQYECEVTRLRRHAREVSVVCSNGLSVRATMAIVATGAARPLITSLLGEPVSALPEQRLIAGVFAVGGDRGRWVRVEIPVPGHPEAVRCTLLQTPSYSGSGTAVLIDPRVSATASEDQLRTCFDAAAHELGLAGAPYLHEPQVFSASVTEVPRRFIAGDNRAPVIIAGDAAQTGHVFSGQTCFINVALALSLCDQLRGARKAIADRAMQSPQLTRALTHYAGESAHGASLLAQASHRHLTRHAPGKWALAGVATAS